MSAVMAPKEKSREQAAILAPEAAIAGRPGGRYGDILALQRAIGNRAVNQLLQAKARVSEPGDRYERETHRIADGAARGTDSDREPSEIPPIVKEVLRSPGQPLDPAARAFFEHRFGHDFSRVRIHSGAKAAESAEVVNARAYTMGQHVAFGSQQYAPRTASGQRLLAHELTHVLQQERAAQEGKKPALPNSTIEVEADRAAEASGRVRVELRSPVCLARQQRSGQPGLVEQRSITTPTIDPVLVDLLAKIEAVKRWLNEHSVVEQDYPRAREVLKKLQLELHKKIYAEVRAMSLRELLDRDLRRPVPVKPEPDYLVWNAEGRVMPRTQYEAEETARKINEGLQLHTSSILGSLVYDVRRNFYGETHDEAMARAAPAANLGEFASAVGGVVQGKQAMEAVGLSLRREPQRIEVVYKPSGDGREPTPISGRPPPGDHPETSIPVAPAQLPLRPPVAVVVPPEELPAAEPEIPFEAPTETIERLSREFHKQYPIDEKLPAARVRKSGEPYGFEPTAEQRKLPTKAGSFREAEDFEPTAFRKERGYSLSGKGKRVTRESQLSGVTFERKRASTEKWLAEKLKLLSNPSHPAHSLVVVIGHDEKGNPIYDFRKTTRITKAGKIQTGRYPGSEHGLVVQVGHKDASASGAPESFMLEDADFNIMTGETIESKGAFSHKVAVDVDGVPIEYSTLKGMKRRGELKNFKIPEMPPDVPRP